MSDLQTAADASVVAAQEALDAAKEVQALAGETPVPPDPGPDPGPDGPGMPDYDLPAINLPASPTVLTSASAFTNAWGKLANGQWLQVKNVTFSGDQLTLQGKSASARVEFLNCQFRGGAKGSQLNAVWVNNCAKVQFVGGDFKSDGNNGIRFDDCTDLLWWDFFIHDCAGQGVMLRGITKDSSGFDLRGEIANCGLDLSLDPHADKGSGNHAMNMGTGTGRKCSNGRIVLWVHDQQYGAGCQVENTFNTEFNIDARRCMYVPRNQTGGNPLQFWGTNSNNTVKYIYADTINQALNVGDGISGSGNVVEYGRSVNSRVHPSFAKSSAFTYQDVEES
jgi:hypothetical protein